MLGEAFVVTCQVAVRGQPGQGALHHRAPGQHGEAALSFGFAHDVHDDAQQPAGEGDQPY